MSATNRGKERKPYDFYATPVDVAEKLLENISWGGGRTILEPSAGNGNVIQAIRNKVKDDIHITGFEIRKEEKEVLETICDSVVVGEDFLEYDFEDKKYDVVIGNPPYSSAKEFVEKSLKLLNKDGILIFLLRTAFLESKSRYEFWQQNPISGLYVLSKRPSFTGKGTDATSYS